MMEARQESERVSEAIPQPPHTPVIAIIARLLARAWVVALIVFGAGFAGIAISQVMQQRATLQELKQYPGPSAYAVVAYREELERQIRAFSEARRGDAVPPPPSRPELMEEIDFARARNNALAQAAQEASQSGGSGPPL